MRFDDVCLMGSLHCFPQFLGWFTERLSEKWPGIVQGKRWNKFVRWKMSSFLCCYSDYAVILCKLCVQWHSPPLVTILVFQFISNCGSYALFLSLWWIEVVRRNREMGKDKIKKAGKEGGRGNLLQSLADGVGVQWRLSDISDRLWITVIMVLCVMIWLAWMSQPSWSRPSFVTCRL